MGAGYAFNVSNQLDIGRSMLPKQAAAVAEARTSATGNL